ncbi:hypothetical protein [Variovorax sp. PCZ-1]|uniref:hypothetical protein n=1 Tax=Variovorax sp. PCZ-1 TaxID=2835533 RepID=UPI001BCBB91A|nr:hypothetical protein [Variovorax sp. PCZ-1]MBS7808540.1 hypothetical protein [Variovorax sp. PCZ-1]
MLRTFDLFDTLIARRCISPLSVYEAVETISRIPGLAESRSRAGHQLWLSQTPHSTQDIYRLALSNMAGSPMNAAQLAQLEYEREYAECLPVLRAMDQLDRASIVVSDMHHPAWVIERLYSGAARSFSKRWMPSIHISNQDKHNGSFWQALASQGLVAQHLGDNAHSDFAQAQAHGHQATIFDWAHLQATEQSLATIGLHSVARACRSTRLQCVPQLNAPFEKILSVMCSHVVPILALGCLLLNALMKQEGKTSVVFVGRDGAVWQSVFQAIDGQTPTTRVALSRRLMQTSPHTAVSMLKSCVSRDTLVADLVGSGASWADLQRTTGFAMEFQLCHLLRYPSASSVANISLQSLVDFSHSPIAGMYALEAFCEESYASTCDADWINLGKQSGFAQIRATSDDHLSLAESAASDALHGALECAQRELRFEMSRANDQCSIESIQALLRNLVLELCQEFETINACTQFWNRNAKMATPPPS